jgi:hypothetical protein
MVPVLSVPASLSYHVFALPAPAAVFSSQTDTASLEGGSITTDVLVV